MARAKPKLDNQSWRAISSRLLWTLLKTKRRASGDSPVDRQEVKPALPATGALAQRAAELPSGESLPQLSRATDFGVFCKSESRIGDLDEDVAINFAFAPGGFEVGEGLGGDGFLYGFTRRF